MEGGGGPEEEKEEVSSGRIDERSCESCINGRKHKSVCLFRSESREQSTHSEHQCTHISHLLRRLLHSIPR